MGKLKIEQNYSINSLSGNKNVFKSDLVKTFGQMFSFIIVLQNIKNIIPVTAVPLNEH